MFNFKCQFLFYLQNFLLKMKPKCTKLTHCLLFSFRMYIVLWCSILYGLKSTSYCYFTKMNENSNIEHLSDIEGALFSHISVPIWSKSIWQKMRSFTGVKKLTMNIIVLSSNFWIFTGHCKHFEQFSGHHLWVSNNQGTCGQIDGWIVYSTKCVSWRLNRLVPCTSPSLNEHLRLRVSAIIGLTCVKVSQVFWDGWHSITGQERLIRTRLIRSST